MSVLSTCRVTLLTRVFSDFLQSSLIFDYLLCDSFLLVALSPLFALSPSFVPTS